MVVDELHLLLRITAVLERNVVLEMVEWDKLAGTTSLSKGHQVSGHNFSVQRSAFEGYPLCGKRVRNFILLFDTAVARECTTPSVSVRRHRVPDKRIYSLSGSDELLHGV